MKSVFIFVISIFPWRGMKSCQQLFITLILWNQLVRIKIWRVKSHRVFSFPLAMICKHISYGSYSWELRVEFVGLKGRVRGTYGSSSWDLRIEFLRSILCSLGKHMLTKVYSVSPQIQNTHHSSHLLVTDWYSIYYDVTSVWRVMSERPCQNISPIWAHQDEMKNSLHPIHPSSYHVGS